MRSSNRSLGMACTVLKRVVDESYSAQVSVSKRARLDEDRTPPTSQRSMPNNKGSVLRVRLRNFMTYGNVQFEPGKGLNVIVGPNGTGKSSFVCAICLGLAGRLPLLGRGDRVSEFIKRGEDFAEVEVVLCTGVAASPITIYRKIKKDNSSEWKINGSTVLLKDVEQAKASLNVQLDNLCQFLPQDRVVEFAKLSPKDLLLETEKAVGDSELSRLHSQLTKSRNDMKGLASRVTEHAAHLARLKDQNQALAWDVERASRLNQLQQEIDDYKKKKLWLKFDELNEKLNKTRADLKSAMDELRAQGAKVQAAEAPFKDRLALKQRADHEQRRIRLQLANLENQKTALDDELLLLAMDYEQTEHELQHLQEKATERRLRIEKLTGEVDTLQSRKGALGEPPDNTREMESIKLEVRELVNSLKNNQARRSDLESDLEEPRRDLRQVKIEIQKLEDVRNQRLRALSRQDRGVLSAYDWVQANRHRFQAQVYGPILAEVHVADKQHAKYLEMQCPNFLWGSFVSVCDADRRLLEAEVGKKFHVNIINYTGDPYATVPVPDTLQRLAGFEIHRTLAMCFEAPRVVQLILNDHAGISRAFVGTMKTEAQIDQVVEVPGVTCVWTPKSQYTVTTSRYSDSKSSRVMEVREPKLFTSSASQQEKDRLIARSQDCEKEIAKLEAIQKKYNSEIKQVETKLSEKKRRHELLVQSRQDFNEKLRALDNQIQPKLMSIQSLEAHSQMQDKQRIDKRAAEINRSRLAKLAKFHQMLTEMVSAQLELDPTTLAVAELEEQAKFLKKQVEDFQAEGGHLLTRVNELKLVKQSTKQKAIEAKKEAKKVADLPDPALEEKFLFMPGNVEDVEQCISERRLEMSTIVVRDPGALAAYQERAQRIQELEATLAQERATLEGRESEIQQTREEWLPKLREVVDRMSSAFAKLFEEIGCVGKLSLQEHEDYDKFEMQLLVKFRAEEVLQPLSSQRHSGGERSVSTMLYLIALQELTCCPFRVVDEINQGMDAVNERKVFTTMVEAARRPDTPQCFLLTPKLLSQLKYSSDMTILCIMNGPRNDTIAPTWRTDPEYKFYKPCIAAAY